MKNVVIWYTMVQLNIMDSEPLFKSTYENSTAAEIADVPFKHCFQ